MNFDKSPILVFWETTKACRLACRHCRAEAIAEPLPTQLSHEEGLAFIDRLLGFAPYRPVLILTGGDPFMRSDLFELAAHAGQAGLPIGFAPSVTPLLDREAASRMLEVGPKTVSISLDGARPQTHEGIRGVDGHFERTLDAVRMLVDVGHTVQINTTVMRPNVEELADVAALVASLAAHIWEVFFLIKVGRGQELEELTPEENEDVVQFLFDASHYGFIVRTVEAPFFRRVVAWRRDDGTCTAGFGGPLYERLTTGLVDRLGPARLATKAQSVGTRDGKGILFVSHDGYLYPSGFLPVPLGNVKRDDVVAVYRTHPLLRSIRRAEFTGRCGACEYADACGGSRARAFATSLNALGEDPACAYSPAPLDLVL
ncbi:MAG TPA: TIGR04053 family radical SAM/SPASM domain-containing protein [Actinomycetota bacterium]|nr:TIGR04053 family radical SAM/SPASM domain-containing protein [Actinomycetota bacterium]